MAVADILCYNCGRNEWRHNAGGGCNNYVPMDSRRQQELLCVRFNKLHPLGTAVILSMDSGEQRETTTRSEAYVCDSGYPVIFLTGVAGYYLLDRVRAAA